MGVRAGHGESRRGDRGARKGVGGAGTVTLFPRIAPVLTLAPMQDVTDGAFWTLIHRYGGADVYWTEYLRVSASSTPEKRIINDITTNTTGQPVVAQMIGNDIPALVRTAKVLQQ